MKGFYTSRNNPASLKHFTLVVLGNNSLNSSQCSIDAKPPAEHPERRAWNMDKHIKRGIKMVNWAALHHKHYLISVAHSLWHQIFHSSWPDALSPEIQFLGLWSNNRIIKFFSQRPKTIDPDPLANTRSFFHGWYNFKCQQHGLEKTNWKSHLLSSFFLFWEREMESLYLHQNNIYRHWNQQQLISLLHQLQILQVISIER